VYVVKVFNRVKLIVLNTRRKSFHLWAHIR